MDENNNNFVEANSTEKKETAHSSSYSSSSSTNTKSTNNGKENQTNSNFTRPQKVVSNFSKSKNSFNFGKNIILPFASGILGASLVLGVAFNVPSLKQTLVGKASSSGSNQSNSINYNNVNTNLVSISNFSDTGVAVAQKVLPSIVGIKVEYSVTTIFSKSQSTVAAEGSGVVISSDGYILTNNHVVNSSASSSSSGSYYELGKATKLSVYFYNDETAYPATVVGTDVQTDLAVIKVDRTDLTSAELGDSDTVQVGEWCMAIGNPLGMKSSVTTGSISALNRTITDSDEKTYTLTQTDAAINSGNSGGALVNSKGQVIGINTLKASGTGVEGLGFAIPINSTKSIYSDLIQYNKVKRPYIGIVGSDISEQTIKQNPTLKLVIGAYIKTIVDYSPAEKAGLKIGDIIIEADGEKVTSMDDLNEIKNKHNIGDTMSLKISRDGNEKTISITLSEEP